MICGWWLLAPISDRCNLWAFGLKAPQSNSKPVVSQRGTGNSITRRTRLEITAPNSATPDAPSDPPVPLAERTPPPPLFACKTWNRDEYFSDSTTPAQRCAPMQTTGLGGDPAQGAGAACMVVSDFCQPVPEAALCESWRDHLIRSEAIVEFDRAQDRDAAAAELERIRTIVAHSTCD